MGVLLLALAACAQTTASASTVVSVWAEATHAQSERAAPSDTVHYPLPTCTEVPAPRFTAASWVAPAGLDPDVEEVLRTTVFGTLGDPREGLLHEVMLWQLDTSERESFPSRSLEPVATAGIALVRSVPGERPLGIQGSNAVALESVGPAIDVVGACRTAVAVGRETNDGRVLNHAEFADVEARHAIRARCPGYGAAAQLAILGEADLANDVVRWIGIPTEPERAVRLWWSASRDIGLAIDAFIMGDLCLARHATRRVLVDWAAFQASPSAAVICQRYRRCGVEESAELLAVGIERRSASAREYTHVPILDNGPLAPEVISQLVAAIEDVRIPLGSSYSGSPWAGEPLHDGLVRMGDAAIPALIAVLAQPDRLTRSPVFEQGDVYPYHLMSVHRFAEDLLREMLVMPVESPYLACAFALDAAPDAAAIYRARFERVRGMSLAERCFTDLRESSDNESWAHSAFCLIEEAPYRADARPSTDADGNRPLVGEPLRARTSPTVTQVMSGRALDALRLASPDACTIAEYTIDWDPRGTPSWLPRFHQLCARTEDCDCTHLLGADPYASTPTSRARLLDHAEIDEAESEWSVVARYPAERASRRFLDRAAREDPLTLYARAIIDPRLLDAVPGLRERVLTALADHAPSTDPNMSENCWNCEWRAIDAMRRCDDLAMRVQRAAEVGADWSTQFSIQERVTERDVRIARMVARVRGEGPAP